MSSMINSADESPGERVRPKEGGHYANEILGATLELLLGTGHSRRDIEQIVQNHLRECDSESAQPLDPAVLRLVTKGPHVPALWRRLPKYVDSKGNPRPLRLHARGPSLAKLIKRVLPGDKVSDVVASLVRAGVIARRAGWYRSTSRVMQFNDELTARAHTLVVVHATMTTVRRNMLSRDPNKNLLERAAINFFVPLSAVAEIHRRIKRDLGAAINKADSDLCDAEVETGSEPTAMMGLAAVAFDDTVNYQSLSGSHERGSPAPRRRTQRQWRVG